MILELLKNQSEVFAAPQTASKLAHLLRSSPYNDDIISVVQLDPALTARVLQVCNSVAFRGNQPISSLDDAVKRLGFSKLLRVVWQMGVGKKMMGPLPVFGLELGELWRHSMTTAITAEELLKLTSLVPEDSSTAFTAALLHDFGKIALNNSIASMNKFAMGPCVRLKSIEDEVEVIGVTHAQVGAELLQHWGQADTLVRAVAGHHATDPSTTTPLSWLVNLADLCTHNLGGTKGWDPETKPIVSETMKLLEISHEDLDEAMEKVLGRVEEIEIFMCIV